jgi:hypothetical protein
VSRPLHLIAEEIERDWRKPFGQTHLSCVSSGARPYLDAMKQLTHINQMYIHDSASSIVRYFLSNATNWRGETARRIKAELNEMLKV